MDCEMSVRLAKRKPSLTTLPVELFLKIIKDLDATDLVNLERTNASFNCGPNGNMIQSAFQEMIHFRLKSQRNEDLEFFVDTLLRCNGNKLRSFRFVNCLRLETDLIPVARAGVSMAMLAELFPNLEDFSDHSWRQGRHLIKDYLNNVISFGTPKLKRMFITFDCTDQELSNILELAPLVEHLVVEVIPRPRNGHSFSEHELEVVNNVEHMERRLNGHFMKLFSEKTIKRLEIDSMNDELNFEFLELMDTVSQCVVKETTKFSTYNKLYEYVFFKLPHNTINLVDRFVYGGEHPLAEKIIRDLIPIQWKSHYKKFDVFVHHRTVQWVKLLVNNFIYKKYKYASEQFNEFRMELS